MQSLDLHITLQFSESIKPADAAAFVKAAIDIGYIAVAGGDDAGSANAADAYEDAHVGPVTNKLEEKSVKKDIQTKTEKNVKGVIAITSSTLQTLMEAAHFHTEDLQELEDEGSLKSDREHKAHMKSLYEAVAEACELLGVDKPKPI